MRRKEREWQYTKRWIKTFSFSWFSLLQKCKYFFPPGKEIRVTGTEYLMTGSLHKKIGSYLHTADKCLLRIGHHWPVHIRGTQKHWTSDRFRRTWCQDLFCYFYGLKNPAIRRNFVLEFSVGSFFIIVPWKAGSVAHDSSNDSGPEYGFIKEGYFFPFPNMQWREEKDLTIDGGKLPTLGAIIGEHIAAQVNVSWYFSR